MKLILVIITNAIVLFLISIIFPKSLQFDNFETTLLASIIISVCNLIAYKTIFGQIIVFFTLFLSAILGWLGVLFAIFAIETLFLFIADKVLYGMSIGGFWWGMLTAVFLTLINSFLYKWKN